MKILFFDTETTGLPKDCKAQLSDSNNWPRLIELAFVVVDNGKEILRYSRLIKPDGFIIPNEAAKVNGITTDQANKDGVLLTDAINTFYNAVNDCDYIVGHNVSFDRKIVGSEYFRLGIEDNLHGKNRFCTMFKSTKYCGIKGKRGNKWPNLQELHNKLFGCDFNGAHRAIVDVDATIKCFNELVNIGVIQIN